MAQTYRLIIKGGAHDRHQVEDDIKGHKRCHDDEYATLELGIVAEEIDQSHAGYHGVIGGVAHAHQLGDDGRGELLGKHQRGLETKQRLLPLGKDVVEVGQHAVELIGIGIPPCQQRHLSHNSGKHSGTAGHDAIDCPQGSHHRHHAHAAPNHRVGVGELGIGKQDKEQGKHQIAQHHPLHRQESAARLFLYAEII